MADQRAHAGNLGDVIKHAVVVAVADWWHRHHPGDTWAETHAGFRDYDVHDLGGASFDAARARTLGRLRDHLARDGRCGLYGEAIASWLARGAYPGSLALTAHAAPSLTLRAFDIGAAQVASFAGDPRIDVRVGDGFAGVEGADIVVCDPFWNAPETWDQVVSLCARQAHVLVWFPCTDALDAGAFSALGLDGVIVRDGDAGAGVAWRLPPAAADAALVAGGAVAAACGVHVETWRASEAST